MVLIWGQIGDALPTKKAFQLALPLLLTDLVSCNLEDGICGWNYSGEGSPMAFLSCISHRFSLLCSPDATYHSLSFLVYCLPDNAFFDTSSTFLIYWYFWLIGTDQDVVVHENLTWSWHLIFDQRPTLSFKNALFQEFCIMDDGLITQINNFT